MESTFSVSSFCWTIDFTPRRTVADTANITPMAFKSESNLAHNTNPPLMPIMESQV
jgi:hypothetical protein